MKSKQILTAAIMCAMLTLGIGGTSSAAEVSKNFSTLQVESQELSSRHHEREHRPPPPPPPRPDDRRRGGDFGATNYGGSRDRYDSRGSYNSRDRYDSRYDNRSGRDSRRVDINVRKVTIKVNTPSRI